MLRFPQADFSAPEEIGRGWNLLMQLTNGSHGDMVLPEDIVLPLKDMLMLEELEHQLAGNEVLQKKLLCSLASGKLQSAPLASHCDSLVDVLAKYGSMFNFASRIQHSKFV